MPNVEHGVATVWGRDAGIGNKAGPGLDSWTYGPRAQHANRRTTPLIGVRVVRTAYLALRANGKGGRCRTPVSVRPSARHPSTQKGEVPSGVGDRMAVTLQWWGTEWL